MQGARLQFILGVSDDGEFRAEKQRSVAALPAAGHKTNRQVSLLASLLDKPDELNTFHVVVTVSDNFVRLSSTLLAVTAPARL